jgi:hypothetical protein
MPDVPPVRPRAGRLLRVSALAAAAAALAGCQGGGSRAEPSPMPSASRTLDTLASVFPDEGQDEVVPGDFPAVAVGESDEALVKVHNTLKHAAGVRTRVVQTSQERAAAADPAFKVVGGTCLAKPVPAGGTCDVVVRYSPKAEGTVSSELQILLDGVAQPIRVRLKGEALPGTPQGPSAAPSSPPEPGTPTTPTPVPSLPTTQTATPPEPGGGTTAPGPQTPPGTAPETLPGTTPAHGGTPGSTVQSLPGTGTTT